MSRGPEANAEQRQAIECRAPRLVLKAGAGSGKTWTLIEHYVALVEEGLYSPEQILLITFTEKAASELKERLLARFATQGEARLESVRRATVGTIHSFCRGLLADYPTEAGVPPAFDVMEEARTRLLAREVAESLIEGLLAQGNRDAQRALALLEEPGKLTDALLRLNEERRNLGVADLPEPRLELPRPDLDRLLALTREIFEAPPLLTKQGKPNSNWEKVHATFELVLPTLEGVLAGDLDPGLLLWVLSRYSLNGHVFKVNDEGDWGRFARELPPLLEEVKGWALESLALPLRKALTNLVLAYEARLWQAKLAHGALDFNDLMQRAVDLLEARPDVLAEVGHRYRVVLLDEAQDVNFLQHRLVELLAKQSGCSLRLVGDPLQSIYSWRGALPELFTRQLEAGHSSLLYNYRAHPRLIEFTNFAGRQFYKAARGEALEPGLIARKAQPAKGYPVPDNPRVLVLKQDAQGETGRRALELRLEQADALAALVQKIVGSQEYLVQKGDEYLPATYGDICILYRAGAIAPLLEAAFERARIPYFVEGNRAFYGRQEVQDLISLLRFLINPADEVRLAAVLRSPLVALSEEGLFRLRYRNGRPLPLGLWAQAKMAYAREELPAEDKDRLAAFVTLIGRLRQLAGAAGPGAVLEAAVSQTGYKASLLGGRGAARRYSNVAKLLRQADEAGRQGLSMGEFAEFIETVSTSEFVEESEAALVSEQANVVRLMTIHKAKGLEFPIVLLVDLGRKLRNDTDKVGLHSTPEGQVLGVVVDSRPAYLKEGKTPSYEASKASRKLREQVELANLLYVAMTRAKDWLVLAGLDGELRNTPGEWVKEAVDGQEIRAKHPPLVAELDARDLLGAPSPGRTPLRLSQRYSEELSRLRLLEAPGLPQLPDPEYAQLKNRVETLLAAPVLPAKRSRFRVSELVVFAACPLKHFFQYELGLAPPGKAMGDSETPGEQEQELPGFGDEEVAASVRGAAIHRALERWEPDIDLAALAAEVAGQFSPSLEPDLLAALARFSASPFAPLLAETPRRYRECPISIALNGWTLSAVLDAIAQDEGEYHLLEYKSLAPTPQGLERARATYGLQVMTYALATSKLFGAPPASAQLYFTENGATAEFPVDAEALARTEQRLRLLLGQLASQTGKPRGKPGAQCEGCEYRAVCPEAKR